MKTIYEIDMIVEDILKDNDLSERELSRKIGCGRNSLRKWRASGAPKYIHMALLLVMWMPDVQPTPTIVGFTPET